MRRVQQVFKLGVFTEWLDLTISSISDQLCSFCAIGVP